MTTLTISIPDSAKSKVSELVEKLGGKVVETGSVRDSVLKDLEESFCQVKGMKEGRMPKLSLREALRG